MAFKLYKAFVYSEYKKELSIEEAVLITLDGADHERGAFEEVGASISNTQEFLAKLTQVLHDRRVIYDCDLPKLFNYSIETAFVEEGDA